MVVTPAPAQSSYSPWQHQLRLERLTMLVELDGVLVPFTEPTVPPALDRDTERLLGRLGDEGVTVAITSGRPREQLDTLVRQLPGVVWFAEHGAWRWNGAGWRGGGSLDDELGALGDQLRSASAVVAGAHVERKTASVSVHWRRVSQADRGLLVAAVETAVDEWLESHPEHERVSGVDVMEIRPRAEYEARVVSWLRHRAPGAPFLGLCDGVTGRDVFLALGPGDVSIAVGASADRRAPISGTVGDAAAARRFLFWLIEARATAGPIGPAPVAIAPPRLQPALRSSLLVIANRTPAPPSADRKREVGGLVAALEPALREHDGVWLGWSGHDRDAEPVLDIDASASPVRASFDMTPRWRRLFYAGFCNRSLWPLLHGFPGKVRYEDDEWAAYVEANDGFARLATELVHPEATIWVHDYHLLLAAAGLRHRGHRGPIGLFLHVPFPSRDAIETLPFGHELLSAMLAFDLIGFHTERWADSFRSAVETTLGATCSNGHVHHRQRSTRVAAFPIPTDAAPFQEAASLPTAPDVAGLLTMLGDRRLLLGVDRLDYSKGIPERLESFERLLERYPAWRGRACFVQVSVPSRADVPEYAELRDRVEHLVGRINGRFGEADWMPVRYLYRSYPHDVLAQLYRIADVGVVTPLRDGMNLVAKEFVAAQDPARPGVLVLSQFAGAAEELSAAVLTNPYHRDGLADDLHRALSMSSDERLDRHRRLLRPVVERTPAGWARDFLVALEATHSGPPEARS